MTKPLAASDPILGPARGSELDFWLAATDWPQRHDAALGDYIREVYRLAPLVGVDPAIVVAQSALECDNWRSEAWVQRRNPAGIGILGDPNKLSRDLMYEWKDGTDAARGQLAHLIAYVGNRGGTATPESPNDGDSIAALERLGIPQPINLYDPRWSDVPLKWRNSVHTIAELGGKWATVPDYGARIAKRGNELFGFTEETTPVTNPPIYNLATDYGRYGLTRGQANEILTHRFANRQDVDAGITGKPSFIVLHIQDGTTSGSLQYWVGVQASATMMANKDGSLLKVIPEAHGPWTNGDVQSPTYKADEILSFGGNPNIWTLSIEAEGTPYETHPAALLDAIEWQCRDWMARYKIPVSSILRHGWINSVTRANCPGSYFDAIISRLQEDPMPTADFPEGMDAALAAEWFGEVKSGGQTYHWDPTGPVSLAWLENGKQTGQWPKLQAVRVIQDTPTRRRRYFTFANGLTLWDTTGKPVAVLRAA